MAGSEQETRGRALVAVSPPDAGASSGVARPLAGFLTQLLACEARLPPYRARRRIEPDAATRAYAGGATAEAPRRGTGRVV